MLSLLDESDLINEHTQEINELIKLHILGVWQNVHEFIRQLANLNSSSPTGPPAEASLSELWS